jgi:hypothetical protein
MTLIDFSLKNSILSENKWAVYTGVTPSEPKQTNNSTPTRDRATTRVKAIKKKMTNWTPMPSTLT